LKIVSVQHDDFKKKLNAVIRRDEDLFNEIDVAVDKIIADVKHRGDKAVFDWTAQFDSVELNDIRVSKFEIQEAFHKIDKQFIEILKEAKENIEYFHEKQKQNSWFHNKEKEIVLGQLITPIERVGIYVPGGKAVYPSTVLMNVVPAKVAGVKSIAITTPPQKDGKIHPHILAAASIVGVDEIYKIGGAQSIAALAYGTQIISPVNKIVGPGNIYVARAKKKVFGKVDIDMIAGPSEICVIADKNADPRFVAADLLSQAEHDEMASAILITTSIDLARRVSNEVEIQISQRVRKDIISKSINKYGAIFVVEDLDLAIKISNELAPEHLELMVKNPFEMLWKVKNAGAIFLGNYAPEPLGDYFAGPNHTLPTSGTAKFSSPLSVNDFIKKSSVIYYGKNDLEKIKDKVAKFAEEEGLDAHANSIKVRF
jgi:histidinol dehydrogenase